MAAFSVLLFAPQLQARTWTSADGKQSFEGELEAYDPATGVLSVTIEGNPGSFHHAILSVADIAYLKQLGEYKRGQQVGEPVAEAEPAAEAKAVAGVQAEPVAEAEAPAPTAPPSIQSNESAVKPVSAKAVPKQSFKVPTEAVDLIDYYCIDCHEDGTEKGGMRFDNLEELTFDGWVNTLNHMQEQIYFGYMPPKDEDQLTEKERGQMLAWLSQELKSLNSSKLEEKLMTPKYGNYVDHEKLFSGEYQNLKPFTPDRRWLISEFIFETKMSRILEHAPTRDIYGKRHSVIGDSNRRGVSITNPFLLPTDSGVRYYANTSLHGGHLLTMITNSREAADYMMTQARRNSRYLPAVSSVMEQEDKDNQILASREAFLDKFIERVLIELYGSKHESLLPRFVTVTGPEGYEIIENDGKKRAGFHHGIPGRDDMMDLYHTMLRVEKDGDSDIDVIRKCEIDWFKRGLNERKIQTRITVMKNYMTRMRQEFEGGNYARTKLPEYRPLEASEMEIIKETILSQREKGDRYSDIINKCMKVWEADFKEKRDASGPVPDDKVDALVEELFVKILERSPDGEEVAKYRALTNSYFVNLGNLKGIQKLLQTFFLRSDFAYRYEFGEGQADPAGRKMLSPRDASYAISYALTDNSPDDELRKAAESGQLNTKEDYKREVLRLLAKRDQYYIVDESVEKMGVSASLTKLPIRKLRFFREFFGYPNLLPIFKDEKRFGGNYDKAKARLVSEADRLVEHILEKDENVFEELLTTEDFYVYHSGDNEAMTASAQRVERIYEYFKDTDWRSFKPEDLLKHSDFLLEADLRGVITQDIKKGEISTRALSEFQKTMESYTLRLDEDEKAPAPYVAFSAHGKGDASTMTGGNLAGEEVAKFFNIKLDHWDYPTVQPAKIENRKGMLTHPAWLIAYSQNTETDPIHRGKWVREKLLAGTIPDVPITVDAVVPEDHTKTMRQRLVNKTEQPECWKCHVDMNPLGYTFEMYDDFGRFRVDESIEHPENLIEKRPDKGSAHEDLRDIFKTMKVDPRGKLVGTGDSSLDGEVEDAIDLAGRLGKSRKVRQSIIRYAFRYFMGRNEFLSDSATLMDAERAYVESGGSFDAVIVSLLTSDSFIYRKSYQP
jgi:hypothetical protein